MADPATDNHLEMTPSANSAGSDAAKLTQTNGHPLDDTASPSAGTGINGTSNDVEEEPSDDELGVEVEVEHSVIKKKKKSKSRSKGKRGLVSLPSPFSQSD